jgi:predicted kinase
MMEILIGPMCSGKSTYAAKCAKQGAIIVNDDALVTAFHGGDYTLYDKKLKPLYRRAELNAIIDAIAVGRDVVVDRANCMRVECRQKYIGLAKSLSQKVMAAMFDNLGPDVHAARRLSADARGLSWTHWLEAARRHQDQYTAPTLTEGFDEIVAANRF